MLTLAETLAGQFRTDEAIELYWRAFDKATELDAKLATVTHLTELYLQGNQLDRLLNRLEHEGRERDGRPEGGVAATVDRRRDQAMCIAQALASSGDLGGAKAELERLLAVSNRDTALLKQLSKLAEEEGDFEASARYQNQLVELTNNDDETARLATLYSRAGEIDEAQAIWSKLAEDKIGSVRAYRAIDDLLFSRKYQTVAEITESMIRKDPGDWEALYRSGIALAALQKRDEAATRFRALLTLSVSDDEKNAEVKSHSRNRGQQAAPPTTTLAAGASLDRAHPLEHRIATTYLVRYLTGLDPRASSYRWSPEDFGHARMVALAALVSPSPTKASAAVADPAAEFERAAQKTPPDVQALWNWFYLNQVRLDNAGVFEAARKLSHAAPTDPSALWAYLYALGGRHVPIGREFRFTHLTASLQQEEGVPALEKDELDHVLACYRAMRARRPELAEGLVLLNLSDELKRAQRLDEEARFYREAVAGSTTLGQIAGALLLAARPGTSRDCRCYSSAMTASKPAAVLSLTAPAHSILMARRSQCVRA